MVYHRHIPKSNADEVNRILEIAAINQLYVQNSISCPAVSII